MSKEDFKEYYKKEGVTNTYDIQREGTKYRGKKRQKELKIFLELLNKKEGEKVLELGCSSGVLTKHLGEVVAIDTSIEMLTVAKHKNPQANCLALDMFNLSFNDRSFDKVVTMRVWNHLNENDLKLALKEAKRVLKKGGVLVFDIEEKNYLRKFINFFYKRIFKITGFKVYQYSLRKINLMLREEGFMLETMKFLNHRIGRQAILKLRKK